MARRHGCSRAAFIPRRRPPRPSHDCPHGKVRFPDHRSAVDFLHYAHNCRTVAAASGVPTARREQRAYRCALCRGYHVTSQADSAH